MEFTNDMIKMAGIGIAVIFAILIFIGGIMVLSKATGQGEVNYNVDCPDGVKSMEFNEYNKNLRKVECK